MNSHSSRIDKSKISTNALKVVSRLGDHGYQAFLVGGCVRDIFLGKSPKDFDIATNAHPDEISKLFRNARIVGRRFKIVHVRFGREVVEVTTFRGPHAEKYDENHTDAGMTVSDNIYGTLEEDAFRRDFAMNALYYNPDTHELIDLADGARDITERIIRTIGTPEERFREDPVRMLRASRFKAKLDFDMDEATAAAIRSSGYLVQDVAPARLFEEVLKMFLSGYALATYRNLKDYDLYSWLFPDSNRALETGNTDSLTRLALASTDRRISEELSVTPAFIYAAILWYPFVAEKERLQSEGETHLAASNEAASNIISKQQLFTSIPRRFSGPIRDIWFLQFRLPARFGNKPDFLLGHKRFRAAYDFLLLREQAGEKTRNLGDWWTEYQEATPERREEMKREASQKSRRKGQRKRGGDRRENRNYIDKLPPTW